MLKAIPGGKKIKFHRADLLDIFANFSQTNKISMMNNNVCMFAEHF